MGTGVTEIRAHCDYLADKYGSPYFIGGLSIVDALRGLGVERVAVNEGCARRDWKSGYRRFLTNAGFDVVYHGTFVDQGLYPSQEEVEALWWVFPMEVASESMRRVAEAAPQAEAVVLTGIPNFQADTGIPRRAVALAADIEAEIGRPVVATDFALFWSLFRHLNIAPKYGHGYLLDRADATLDDAERLELWKEAQKLLAEEGGAIITAFYPAVAAVRSNCSGYAPHPARYYFEFLDVACSR